MGKFLEKVYNKLKAVLIYRFQFQSFGQKSRIDFALRIDGAKNIIVGSHVHIQYKTWLGALPLTGFQDCCLTISDGCVIGNFNHIYCTQKITIEENVLTADKVYISDNLHSYEDINIPIWKQPIKQIHSVVIGQGSWLGENVCVIGASIGKHCVIGANSVVTKDIPAYSVAVGVPAKVVKRYNFETQQWEKV